MSVRSYIGLCGVGAAGIGCKGIYYDLIGPFVLLIVNYVVLEFSVSDTYIYIYERNLCSMRLLAFVVRVLLAGISMLLPVKQYIDSRNSRYLKSISSDFTVDLPVNITMPANAVF